MGQDESAPNLPPETTHLSIARLKLCRIPFYISPDHPLISIDAPHNTLKLFPKKLDNLETLDLSDNALYSQDENLNEIEFDFPSLKKLRLSSNQLRQIPKSLDSMRSITDLFLDRNMLESFSTSLDSILHLDLFLNLLSDFPELPPCIEKANLGFNQIRSLSTNNLPNLKELKLSGNILVDITDSCMFECLTLLDLSFNRLCSIPPISKFAPRLSTLILSYNFLDQFPSSLPPTISKIEINHNCIKNWGEPINGLQNLVYLDIRSNHFINFPELPSNIERFIATDNKFESANPITSQGLKGLQFNDNHFKDIPDFSQSNITHLLMRHNSITEIRTDHLSKGIKLIDLTANGISTVPSALFDFQMLTTLILTKNNISNLPDEIGSSQLISLYISDNPMSSLPPLPDTLKEIVACNCQFTELPEILLSCQGIETINFSWNQITELTEIPEVVTLILAGNQISKLPPLPQYISTLDFSHNLLTEFVCENDLLFLTSLDLTCNQISKFQFKHLTSLKILKLALNPLSFKLDLSLFPNIDTVDLFGTDIRHTTPIPNTIRELVTTNYKMAKSLNTPKVKFFRGKKFGYCDTIGFRNEMEDSFIIRESTGPLVPSLYGVIDGHGGYQSSSISASLIPQLFEQSKTKTIVDIASILKNVNEQLFKLQVNDGAALVLALVTPSSISVAHLGDARALVVRKDGSVESLTFDHRPTERSELDVLKDGRAFVASGRLSSHLAISRAIGDFMIDGVSRTPDMTKHPITENDFRLVLACDGVFDVMNNEEVGEIVSKCVDIHKAAGLLTSAAIARGTQDNVSVIVVDIELQDNNK
ncbi:protein phosphatase 2C [Histomonas meleagridis]|uniref:protein phosphatase 2C n=1 Tax=Histomonas meleagridis TaxID=135588 RepID=UPI00355ABBC9|nr:protein phosphatase 2C [Histomonas meleagridis]KAH0806154.1 protein phosphatase 2C [Histomonas meleagridis]